MFRVDVDCCIMLFQVKNVDPQVGIRCERWTWEMHLAKHAKDDAEEEETIKSTKGA